MTWELPEDDLQYKNILNSEINARHNHYLSLTSKVSKVTLWGPYIFLYMLCLTHYSKKNYIFYIIRE